MVKNTVILIFGIGRDGATISRTGLRKCGAQLGTISVGPGSQSTCTEVCRIGRGAQLGAIGPTGLRPALTIRPTR